MMTNFEILSVNLISKYHSTQTIKVDNTIEFRTTLLQNVMASFATLC